jgi:predicted GIY-YIG superfamily endonuclease
MIRYNTARPEPAQTKIFRKRTKAQRRSPSSPEGEHRIRVDKVRPQTAKAKALNREGAKDAKVLRLKKRKLKKKPASGWYLYIIQCSDGTLYTGITNDLDRRLDRHNRGTASRYTRSRRPVRLLHQERCRTKSSALKKEYAVKALSRQEKEEYIESKRALSGISKS